MSFWKHKKVTITGGAGFIGQHLIERLAKEGVDCIDVLDDFSRSSLTQFSNFIGQKKKECPNVDFIYDIRDLTKQEYFFEGDFVDVDVVIHLASLVGSYHFYKEQEGRVAIENTMMDMNVIQACIEAKVPYFSFASSTHVYAQRSGFKHHEEHLDMQRISDIGLSYGWSKLNTEKVLKYNHDKFKGISLLRLNGIYGPGQDIDLEKGSLIPAFSNRVISHPKEEVKIKTNGKERRCFCYIDDAVDAILLCIENSEEKKCVPYNISSGTSLSIEEVAQKIIEISGKDVKLKKSPRYAGLKEQIIPADNIKRDLGWESKTSIDEGLKKTYEDVRARILSKQVRPLNK